VPPALHPGHPPETPPPFRLPSEPVEADLLAKYFRVLGDRTRLRVLELGGPQLPAELDGLRIVHLSDFHLGVPSRGVHAVERPLLPGRHLLEHRIRYRRDEVRGDTHLIELLQVPLDLADRHPPRIEREHLGIKARQPPHPGRHELRGERPGPIARNRQPAVR